MTGKTKRKGGAAASEKPATDGQAVQNAKCTLLPSVNAAAVIEKYNVMGKDVDFPELIEGLRDTCRQSRDGDLSRLESMLIGQATALQTIFTSLARRAANQEYLKQYQTYLTLALKAQTQSRATIQAVVELKYPRQVAFVKQANISNGPQQVNNGITADTGYSPAHAHAEETQTRQNKLLEDGSHEQMHLDTRTTAKASRSNPALETMEAVDRTKVSGR